MTYGLDRRLFVENGPAVQAAKVAESRRTAAVIGWRSLSSDRRMAIVDAALAVAANQNTVDGFPLAL